MERDVSSDDASKPPADDRARYLALIRAHGAHAVSFQGLESQMRFFFAEAGVVAYADTGGAWVAAGAPIAEESAIPSLAKAFVDAARASARRACFFGIEGDVLGAEFRTYALGEQPILDRASWRAAKSSHRKLREQVRRARAKGVVARLVAPEELSPGAPLRKEVDRLETEWLRSRPMPAMGFLVAVEPFVLPDEHRYLVAERAGCAVLFMSCVPIYARGGWLIEDVLRDPQAPNGTAELVFDRLFEDASPGELFTQGLAPLSGSVARWLMVVRDATRPLYNFEGLRAFKERLHPARWEVVSLAAPRDAAFLIALYDSLNAFARGSFVRFGLRALARNPGGTAWLLGVPLFFWTALLAVLVVVDDGSFMGWGRLPLLGWTLFDLLLAILMLRVAQAPRRASLLLLAAFASVDALLSLLHVANEGLGQDALQIGMRVLSFVAPVCGTVALAYAGLRASGPRPHKSSEAGGSRLPPR